VTAPGEEEDPFGSIVREIQQGRHIEPNYERLAQYLRPALRRYFTSRGFPPEDVEDLCQEVFLKVAKSIQSFEGRSRFVCWIFEIAHNLYANELRRRAAEMRQGQEIPLMEEQGPEEEDRRGRAPALSAGGPSPYEEAECRERMAKLRAAIATLPPQMRQCVYLRIYQDLKFREVAEVMNVSLDTVKAHLGEAKKRLRQLASNEGGILGRLDENHE